MKTKNNIFFAFFCQKICIYQKKAVSLHRNSKQRRNLKCLTYSRLDLVFKCKHAAKLQKIFYFNKLKFKIMKTILFFYESKALGSKCAAYTCEESNVSSVLGWQTKLHKEEIKDGSRIGNLQIIIVDNFRITTYG